MSSDHRACCRRDRTLCSGRQRLHDAVAEANERLLAQRQPAMREVHDRPAAFEQPPAERKTVQSPGGEVVAHDPRCKHPRAHPGLHELLHRLDAAELDRIVRHETFATEMLRHQGGRPRRLVVEDQRLLRELLAGSLARLRPRVHRPDERAVFLFSEPAPLPEPPDSEYPLLLNTGRGSSAQWHTGTRTDKSAVLRKLAARAHPLEINPADAARFGITSGQRVRVSSRRGDTEALAFVTATIAPGQIYLAMHGPEVNRLTFPCFDPHSRQPGYKACAVRIGPL